MGLSIQGFSARALRGYLGTAVIIATTLWGTRDSASAAILMTVDLTGSAGNETSLTVLNPTADFASVTLTRSGVSAGAIAGGFGTYGWAQSFNYSQYIAIDVVGNPGITYNFTALNFRLVAASFDPYVWQFASSVDGYAAKQTIFNGGMSSSQLAPASPNWPAGQTGTTTFRLYAQTVSSFSTTPAGLVSSSPAIFFEGTAVPEPASAALVLGGICFLLGRRRRCSE